MTMYLMPIKPFIKMSLSESLIKNAYLMRQDKYNIHIFDKTSFSSIGQDKLKLLFFIVLLKIGILYCLVSLNSIFCNFVYFDPL